MTGVMAVVEPQSNEFLLRYLLKPVVCYFGCRALLLSPYALQFANSLLARELDYRGCRPALEIATQPCASLAAGAPPYSFQEIMWAFNLLRRTSCCVVFGFGRWERHCRMWMSSHLCDVNSHWEIMKQR
ncbi:MAG: hypothetical protein L6R36_007262 [Xanthoria steineri]|nr:MAG: hypothetical protein L6R36_007262 [Xanthoria steineri]